MQFKFCFFRKKLCAAAIVFWRLFCYHETNWDLLLHTPLTIVLTIYYNNIYKYYL